MKNRRRAESAEQVLDDYEFLTAKESKELLRSLPQPTPGTALDVFIWERECGSVERFAAKVGYHPNRISALKSAARGISPASFVASSRHTSSTRKLVSFGVSGCWDSDRRLDLPGDQIIAYGTFGKEASHRHSSAGVVPEGGTRSGSRRHTRYE